LSPAAIPSWTCALKFFSSLFMECVCSSSKQCHDGQRLYHSRWYQYSTNLHNNLFGSLSHWKLCVVMPNVAPACEVSPLYHLHFPALKLISWLIKLLGLQGTMCMHRLWSVRNCLQHWPICTCDIYVCSRIRLIFTIVLIYTM
jgi:hypothetical protein